jgi:hypothetical protein
MYNSIKIIYNYFFKDTAINIIEFIIEERNKKIKNIQLYKIKLTLNKKIHYSTRSS